MHNYAAFASEIKFVLDEDTADAVRKWARTELTADVHAVDIGGDGYQTSSLYFETENLDLFFRRGSTARAKFRVRRYNGGPVVFLERKLKVGNHIAKRRSDAFESDLSRLIGEDEDWSGRWFARRLKHRRLRPICQIAYSRTARVGMSSTGPLRMTLDRAINAIAIDSPSFANLDGAEILPGQCILELKYRVQLPVLFKRLVEEFHLKPHPISKYRMAMRKLGLVGEEERMPVNA